MKSPSEIGKILKKQIESFNDKIQPEEVGEVILSSDGVAEVYGLLNCQSNEMVEFEDGSIGIAQNLEEDTVSVAILSGNISEGCKVKRTNKPMSVPVGTQMLGRVINPMGKPIDGGPAINCSSSRPIESEAPGIIGRESVNIPMQTGIKAIDSMIPIGRGQRELIIGDRNTGKSSIAIDTIINQKNSGVICIYVAIGQKNSTVAKIANQLEENGAMEYSVIVSASASDSPPLQYIAPYSGCAIAEYFRESGKDVLIVYDDLSKHAVAYRALSLLIRRPPGREAYPGDVFYLHSRLLERAACVSQKYGGGSITALPIVETLAGDVSAYIPTNVISITDGQIFLESELFHSGIIPAINPGISVSRVGSAAQLKAMKAVSGKLKLLYSQYRELKSFSQFGGDLDSDTKKRLALGERIVEVLKQNINSPINTGKQVAIVYAVVNGYLDNTEVSDIRKYEEILYTTLEEKHKSWLDRINNNYFDDSDEAELIKILSEIKI